MLSRLRDALIPPHPLRPANWKGRLRPVTVRSLSDSDVSRCFELYSLNEPGRFPPNTRDQFRDSVLRGNSYYLAIEVAGRVMATGGMSYYASPHLAVFCFGLVDPAAHGRGFGTILLLSRLALLNDRRPAYQVLIFALESSIGFYRRFGFRPHPAWTDPEGKPHPSGVLLITARQIRQCRALLIRHGIQIPNDQDKIPLRKAP